METKKGMKKGINKGIENEDEEHRLDEEDEDRREKIRTFLEVSSLHRAGRI